MSFTEGYQSDLRPDLILHLAGAGRGAVIPKAGEGNSALGDYGSVLNGEKNRANGPYSTAAGCYAEATIHNEWAKAGGAFYGVQGSSQNSILNLLNIIPPDERPYPVTPNGAGLDISNRWQPPLNSVQQFMVQFTIVHNSGATGVPGETWTGIYEGVLRNSQDKLSWVGGSPVLRNARQNAGFFPTLGFVIGGNEVIPFVYGMKDRSLHASITVYITQTKFDLK